MFEFLLALLLGAPAAGSWASWKFWVWHRFYGTRFLWGLFLASIGVDLATLPIAYLAGRRLFFPDAGSLEGSAFAVAASIVLLEGVFVYLVIRWSDLDEDMKRERVGLEDVSHSTNLPPEEQGADQ